MSDCYEQPIFFDKYCFWLAKGENQEVLSSARVLLHKARSTPKELSALCNKKLLLQYNLFRKYFFFLANAQYQRAFGRIAQV